MNVTAEQNRHELLHPGKLVTTERPSQCLLVTLPENADVALVYIILTKHHRSLSMWCVLTTTTVWLTEAQEHSLIRKEQADRKGITSIQTLVNGKQSIVSHRATLRGELFHLVLQGQDDEARKGIQANYFKSK